MLSSFHVEHLAKAKSELSANGTRTLNESERKRRSNLVKRVHVEHLEKAKSEAHIVKQEGLSTNVGMVEQSRRKLL